MNNNTETKPTTNKVKIDNNGIFVRGVPVSTTARAVRRKDGSGSFVIITTELATQPGLVLWEQFLDPVQRTDIQLKDGTVTAFPKPKEYEPITLKASKTAMRGDILVLSRAELVA
ncbi:hypothetical protein [Ruficoccus sp. ZRK36]|uniref:hypothetical protein n=1 Tax=Ruficoccus sp. ZRK36 TaxID=2866311 RepID=UPI001C73C05F|nr:hypothetical protein [Ruficoccus sp. ZRK36]QYY35271.1 hypothetical protein K0V07_13340 [Ruficoccus sp. ZRK36]